MSQPLIALTATEVVTKLANGEIKLNEVIQALRTQHAAVNQDINAFEFVSAQEFGNSAGPLHGLPITVKDQIAVTGLPLNHGLDRANRRHSSDTAPVIENLQKAGASIFGKTTLPPYAMDFQTFNARVGITRNPWNLNCTAGGSSGGGAASVATGMSFLDIGADLSGSLRLPAAYCGVYSLMPTDGAIQTQGLLPNGAVLDHFARPGPISRAVEDLEMAWTAMSGSARVGSAKSHFKIACWDMAADAVPLASPVSAVIKAAYSKLSASDHSISMTGLPDLFDPKVTECFGEIMGYETGALMPAPIRMLARLAGKSAAQRSPRFLKPIHEGYRRSAGRYQQALADRKALQTAFERNWADHDALLLPVCGVAPFAHQTPHRDRGGLRDYTSSFDLNGKQVGYFDALTAFTVPISLMGNPVVTIPLGLDQDGLPVGGQLVGKPGGEMELLQIAQKVAAVLPAPRCSYLPGEN